MQAAKKAGKAPDTFYCLELLQATGILTVPGVLPRINVPGQVKPPDMVPPTGHGHLCNVLTGTTE